MSFNCSVLQGIMFFGLAIGSSTSGLLSSFLTHADLYSFGWRLPFILGGVFGLVSVYLRRYLRETPLFTKLKETGKISRKLPIAVVAKNYIPGCLLVFGVGLFTNQVTTVMFQYMPTLLLREYRVLPETVFWANTAAILCYASTCFFWGWIGDRIGRGRAMSIGAVLTGAAAIGMFSNIPFVTSGGTNLFLVWCYVGLGAGFIGLYSSMAASVFPTAVRFTGLSVPYNLSVAFGGGATPVVLTWLVHLYGRSAPVYLAILACVGFAAIGVIYNYMSHDLGDTREQPSPLPIEVAQVGD
jgi:MFS family permease